MDLSYFIDKAKKARDFWRKSAETNLSIIKSIPGTLVDVARATPRTAGEVMNTIQGQKSFTPGTGVSPTLEKILFGDKPIGNIQDRYNANKIALSSAGLTNSAFPLAITGLAVAGDLVPVAGGGEKAAVEAVAKDAGERALIKASPEMFEGFKDITTKVLDKLKGKTTVSPQFISDLTNAGDMKQVERDIVRKKLDEMVVGGNKIPVKQFADNVKDELLPLKRQTTPSGQYEGISLPSDIRGNVANYSEHIYDSPIKTSAGDVHFGATMGDPDIGAGYFGHTRVEDLAGESKGIVPKAEGTSTLINGQTGEQFATGDTRRVIEVQSDLYQKGNLEREQLGTPSKSIISQGEAIRNPNYEKGVEASAKRAEEVAKLQQYNDPSAHFRMIREEVKQAALDGKTKLQLPTGETAMKIEGLGDRTFWGDSVTGKQLENGKIKVGQEIYQGGNLHGNEVAGGGNDFVITDVLNDGKFKAVPANNIDVYNKLKDSGLEVSDRLENMKETFDISGKIDTSNPIYKFYDKEVGKYVKNNYGATEITDPQGVKWWQIDIKPEHTGPVMAHGFAKTKVLLGGAGIAGVIAGASALGKYSERQVDQNKPEPSVQDKIIYPVEDRTKAMDVLKQKADELATPPATAPPLAAPIIKSKKTFQDMPDDIGSLIEQSSAKYGLDPLIAAAFAKQENSTYDAKKISKDHGVGIFQLTPPSRNPNHGGNPMYDQYTDEQLQDPATNIDLGVQQIAAAVAEGKKKFGNDPDTTRYLRDAYLSYQGGPTYWNSPNLQFRKKIAQQVVDYYLGE